MSIYQIIQQVAKEPSKNGKIAILEANKGNEDLKMAFKYAYDTSLNYYVTSSQIVNTGAVAILESEFTLGDCFDLLDHLNERVFTGHAAIEKIENLCQKLKTADMVVFLAILDRDLKCGATSTTANKVWPGLIPEYGVMLCKDSDEKNKKKIKFPAYVQPKADGLRVNFHVRKKMGGYDIQAFSRNGKPIDCLNTPLREELARLVENLPENAYVIDGELLTTKADGYSLNDRQTSNGIGNKAIRGTIIDPERNKFVSLIWDVTTIDEFTAGISKTPYRDRLASLQTAIKNVTWDIYPRLKLMDTIVVRDWNEVKTLYDRAIENNEEGVIVKNIDAPWEAKRSVNCIKFKEVLTTEVKVMKVENGEPGSKYANVMGALLCCDKTETVWTSVGGGFSDAQRTEFFGDHMLGRIVEIEYNGIVKKKNSQFRSHYLPVFIKIRDDKNEAD